MSYVDAYIDREHDRIHVVERKDGNREFKEFPTNYIFYYDDAAGKHTTIFGTPVARFASKSIREFKKETKLHSNKRTWETDINPVFRCLEENYLGVNSPKLHTAFFDIEVDFDPERGYSSPEDPFNSITAISIYFDWLDQLVTLVKPPKTLTLAEAEEIASGFENTFVFEDEKDLLNTFLNLIEDADVLSGWNSEGYDIPYCVMRVNKIMSKDDTRRFCLWGQYPKKRTFERYGVEHLTFDLIGRVHLDYMQVYRKFTYEERHSWALDAIGEYELNERKVAYEGTLDQLYNNDFRKFIDYNRQDAIILHKLDKKLRFMDLANELAHDNTVLLPTVMGAVAVTDQAIINEAHQLGFVVPSRKRHGFNDDKDEGHEIGVAGAYVVNPKKGMHDWIGSIDIKSLYPSTIRALNMGPETIVGQLKPIMTNQYLTEKQRVGLKGSTGWDGLFGSLEYTAVMNKDVGTEITIDWEDGESSTHSASEIWNIIFDSNRPWILSGNGTIFSYEKQGIIPGLLAKWYVERQVLQKKAGSANTAEEISFWDKRQHVKKINLNSLYGALLNPGCRFFDERIGQSVTLSGRIIAKHMAEELNEAMTGVKDAIGEAIIYGDTDSCYFSIWPKIKDEVNLGKMEWNKDICVEIYDQLAETVNESFPKCMAENFHCSPNLGKLISGGRELIALKGLFIKKKRYGVLIYDLDGKRLDKMSAQEAKAKGIVPGVGKIKAMGLDLKRSDTPKVVQDFLSTLLVEVLRGGQKDEIVDMIRKFKIEFTERPGWEKGTPKRVNNLTKYTKEEERLGKANLPGHVRASMNWNNLRRMNNDNYSMKIVDGMKVIVCKLKNNPIGFTSVAYPTDEVHLPSWYKQLPFDDADMEDTIIDQKVNNLLGVLGWELSKSTQIKSTFNTLFSFEDDE